MEQEEQRFYVKNLPPDVTEDDFKSFFANLGEITDVDVKTNYGFFNVKGSNRTLKKAPFVYANKLWNGHEIKLEKAAKENFLTRLAREREEERAVAQPNLASTETAKSPKPLKRVISDDSDSDEGKAGVPKFRGTQGLYPDEKPQSEKDVMSKFSAFDSTWADDDTAQDNSEQLSAILGSGKPRKEKQPVVTGDLGHAPMSKLEKKKRDDDRRRLSLANKSKEKQQQQNLIRNALSSLDAPKSKKITFGSDDEEMPEEKPSLFPDEDDESPVVSFEGKEHFEGVKGKKLLELQSQFNNDDRFKLDERFLEDDKDDQEKKTSQNTPMVRFDPTEPKAEKPKGMPSNPNHGRNFLLAPSFTRFYEVTPALRGAFNDDSPGFSLLAAYGKRNENDTEKETDQPVETIIKPMKKLNPLVADSSESDEMSEEESKEEPKTWAPIVHVPSGTNENFFFSKNDDLFSEAIEFMNKKNSAEAQTAADNYDTTRQQLKKLFRDQAMRRAKNADMFKKKVGGMQKKPKRDPFLSNPTSSRSQ